MVVALVVVVMVLRVRPEDPMAFPWGLGIGHRLQPPGPYGLVGSRGGIGAGLNGDRGRGVPRPGVGVAGGGCGLWGLDDWALGDGDVDEGLRGSCWVAASVVASLAGDRGSRDVVGGGSWLGFGLGFGSGRGRFCCRRTFRCFWSRLGWCW